jgi:hypothetical protein
MVKPLFVAALAAAAVLTVAAVAWAQEQTPIGPLPGQPVEHPATPLWLTLMAIAIALGALGLVVLIGASYVFLSRRFFGKEEAPPPRRPAVRVPPGAGVPPPARAVGHPVSETTPQGAGATGTEVAARRAEAEGAGSAAPAATEERPAAEERSAAEPAAEERPAEEPAAEERQAEAAAEEEPEKQPAPAQHSGPAELDQETFERVRQEQLDKGASPKVAEGRARAAAVKAARQKAGAG